MRLPAHTQRGQHDTRCTHATEGVPECPELLTSAQGPADRSDCERDTFTAQDTAAPRTVNRASRFGRFARRQLAGGRLRRLSAGFLLQQHVLDVPLRLARECEALR